MISDIEMSYCGNRKYPQDKALEELQEIGALEGKSVKEFHDYKL